MVETPAGVVHKQFPAPVKVKTTKPFALVCVGVHAAKYIACKVIDVEVVKEPPGRYVVPVPSAFVFHPAKVKPVFLRLPVFSAALSVAPATPESEVGTVPAVLPFAA